MNEDQFQFARWLEAELEARKWTQADLIRESGLGVGTVRGWMSRGLAPSPRSLRKVAHALGMDVVEVFRAAGRNRRGDPYWAQPSPPSRSEQEVPRPAFSEDRMAYDAADPLADPRLRFWASVEGDLPPGDVEFLREMAQALRERRKRESDGLSD